MKKVYLIGNAKGNAAFAIQQFQQAQTELEASGYDVVNFTNTMAGWHEVDRKSLLKHRLNAMLKCNTVFVLPDWQNDDLALIELASSYLIEMDVIRANNAIIPHTLNVYHSKG